MLDRTSGKRPLIYGIDASNISERQGTIEPLSLSLSLTLTREQHRSVVIIANRVEIHPQGCGPLVGFALSRN